MTASDLLRDVARRVAAENGLCTARIHRHHDDTWHVWVNGRPVVQMRTNAEAHRFLGALCIILGTA